jgi:hypothetical protein
MTNPVYQGIDSLDVAIMGAASGEMLKTLEEARNAAEADTYNEYGIRMPLGTESRPFIIKAHGKKGGYRYTAVDEKTGSIISIKNETRPQLWNIFVSTRAHSLLSRGYDGVKSQVEECLSALQIAPWDYSVNRIDYALDFLAPDFVLDMANFIAPKSKVAPYFATNKHLDDHGDPANEDRDDVPVGSVMRGGRFESVTVGKMPGRQVIIYDKTQAAKVQKTPYWFPAWGLDPNDPSHRVWRIEIRAGRDSWKSLLGPTGQRSYQTVEALLQPFMTRALDEIWYSTNRHDVSNVTRANLHPLWEAAQCAVANLPPNPEPPLTPGYVIDLMRKQRSAMALAQGFGNLNNYLILQGLTPKEICKQYASLIASSSEAYLNEIGEDHLLKKLHTIPRLLQNPKFFVCDDPEVV